MCKDLVEIQLANNPFLNKNSLQDVSLVLPNMRFIDSIRVEELKETKKSETKTAPSNPGKIFKYFKN